MDGGARLGPWGSERVRHDWACAQCVSYYHGWSLTGGHALTGKYSPVIYSLLLNVRSPDQQCLRNWDHEESCLQG